MAADNQAMTAEPFTNDSPQRHDPVATAERAMNERMEFDVARGEDEHAGIVMVRNLSKSDPEEHTHVVRVRDGDTVECSCGSDEYRAGPCKHRVRVSHEPELLEAVAVFDEAPVLVRMAARNASDGA